MSKVNAKAKNSKQENVTIKYVDQTVAALDKNQSLCRWGDC